MDRWYTLLNRERKAVLGPVGFGGFLRYIFTERVYENPEGYWISGDTVCTMLEAFLEQQAAGIRLIRKIWDGDVLAELTEPRLYFIYNAYDDGGVVVARSDDLKFPAGYVGPPHDLSAPGFRYYTHLRDIIWNNLYELIGITPDIKEAAAMDTARYKRHGRDPVEVEMYNKLVYLYTRRRFV